MFMLCMLQTHLWCRSMDIQKKTCLLKQTSKTACVFSHLSFAQWEQKIKMKLLAYEKISIEEKNSKQEN